MNAAEIGALLDNQHYRLVKWTQASEKMDYRRFFDIAGLIGLRMEDPAVFDVIHRKLFQMMQDYPSIAGVRVDHVDGMADPATYLQRLQGHVPLIWAEKILCGEEELPRDWPVQGTTGYEYIARLNDLMIDPQGFNSVRRFWQSLQASGTDRHFHASVLSAKQEALRNLFTPELESLIRQGGQSRDFWIEASAALPVYRTYVHPGVYNEQDCKYIEHVAAVIGADGVLERLSPEDPKNHILLMSWQQLTGPAMAKGLEDTAHYRHTPLLPLNEVGCEAALESPGAAAYCDWINERAAHWPAAMTASSTHDTKRGEDARARLMTLADRPDRWEAFVRKAMDLTAPFKDLLGGASCPAPQTEYFFLQTVIGAWPAQGKIDDNFRRRVAAYMNKAVREAKLDTNWLAPDEAYEKILEKYVFDTLCADSVIAHIAPFAQEIMRLGAYNSLSALTLRLMAPGAADIYQGTELWELSMVDPDNRRPVDYNLRRQMLSEAGGDALAPKAFANWQDGAVKLELLHKLLAVRARHKGLCGVRDVSVSLCPAHGRHEGHILVQAITEEGQSAPSLLAGVSLNHAHFDIPAEGGLSLPGAAWEGTLVDLPPELAGKEIVNVLTNNAHIVPGKKIAAALLFDDLPVCVYEIV
jgi:(1->4)-alpha-D-glucan 1-alpha-D-glucosylmutase